MKEVVGKIAFGEAGMITGGLKGRAPRSCPECRVSLSERTRRIALYCPHCGENLPRGGYCKECNRSYSRGKYCPIHGKKLTQKKEK